MATTSYDQQALAQGKTFVWHEVYGPRSQDLIDFYTKALDWGSQEMDMGGGFTYKMLVANGQPVCGVMGTSEMEGMGDVPPHWSTYIAVDNVDERQAKCEALGATKLHGPMDVPTIGRMVLMQDPGGATFWLYQAAMGE